MPRILSDVKQLVVPRGRATRRIRSGAFRGLRMDLDLASQTQLYIGTFEREVYRWLERLSHEIGSAVDIGAREGEYTLYFLAKTSASRVISFEPELDILPRLASNLQLNNLAHDPRWTLDSRYVRTRETEDECALDALLPTLPKPCLIKVDVEGGEADILRGAPQLLRSPQVRWIIETHSRELEAECVRILSDAGYATRIISHAWWRFLLPELRISQLVRFNRWLAAANDGRV
jgi:hypothetical protein